MLEKNLLSLRAEAQQYTDRACDTLKSELVEEVQTKKDEFLGLRGEMEAAEWRLREVVISPSSSFPPRARGGSFGGKQCW